MIRVINTTPASVTFDIDDGGRYATLRPYTLQVGDRKISDSRSIVTVFGLEAGRSYDASAVFEGGTEAAPEFKCSFSTPAIAATCNVREFGAYGDGEHEGYIVSNTTEAGIVYDETDTFEACPPNTYPGKLTKFLYARYKAFDGASDKGLVILPVELIDDNGIELKKCVMKQIANWKLEDGFKKWVDEACIFTSTLVDRIVTGYALYISITS